MRKLSVWLNGAHDTGEFFLCVIGWTCHAITVSLYMVEQGSTCTFMTSSN